MWIRRPAQAAAGTVTEPCTPWRSAPRRLPKLTGARRALRSPLFLSLEFRRALHALAGDDAFDQREAEDLPVALPRVD
jgi:hypothetical protein